MLNRAHRDGVDFILMNETNKKSVRRHGWLADRRLNAAIITLNRQISMYSNGSGEGYVWLDLGDIVAYSCYCSPNVPDDHLERFIADLGEDIKKHRKRKSSLQMTSMPRHQNGMGLTYCGC